AVSDLLSLDDALPISVGFHAVERGRVVAGDTVVVLGCGMIGMGVLLGAVARGAKVIAIDPSAEKRDLALKFGAEHVLAGGEEARSEEHTSELQSRENL